MNNYFQGANPLQKGSCYIDNIAEIIKIRIQRHSFVMIFLIISVSAKWEDTPICNTKSQDTEQGEVLVLYFQAGKKPTTVEPLQEKIESNGLCRPQKQKLSHKRQLKQLLQSKKRSYKSLPKLSNNIKWKKRKTVSLALRMKMLCITYFLILKNQSKLSALTFNIWNLGFNHKRKVLLKVPEFQLFCKAI